MSKANFINKVVGFSDQLHQLYLDAVDFENAYFDNGYDSGDVIVDGDVTNIYPEKTAANIQSMVTVAQQFKNLLENTATTPADYLASINAARSEV